jgi:hypothetical protein
VIRLLFGVLGGLAGALIGGAVLGMVTAQVLVHGAPGSHGGWTTMAGAEMGGTLGLLLGFIAGAWLVLRDEGRWAGSALTWLWVGALLLIGCLGFVAFS